MQYDVVAFNTATASTNKIHDDDVARSLGFRGGLVPGVDVFAYLCHLPAAQWGVDWLERGVIAARFASPVYDGDMVTVLSASTEPDTLDLELHDPTGAVCATAVARRSTSRDQFAVDIDDWPSGPLPTEPPPASAATITAGDLGALDATFHAARAGEYLDDVRQQLPLFRDGGVAHPGWLLRFANYVLSSNVRLGPWIHVSSDMHFASAVRDGDRVDTRARVDRVWEAKGHDFVALDVLQVVGSRIVTRTHHTAIFRPRGVGRDEASPTTTGHDSSRVDEPTEQPAHGAHDGDTSSPTESTTS